MSEQYPYTDTEDDFLSRQNMYADSYQRQSSTYRSDVRSLSQEQKCSSSNRTVDSSVHLPGMALSFLHSCGLDSSDLAHLAELPEHLITVETLPQLLLQVKERKLSSASSSRPLTGQPLDDISTHAWEENSHTKPIEYPIDRPPHPVYPLPPEQVQTWQDRWGNPRQESSSTSGVSGSSSKRSSVPDHSIYMNTDPYYHSRALSPEVLSRPLVDCGLRPLLSLKLDPPVIAPTRMESLDFNCKTPPAFPHVCCLCDISVSSTKDWFCHVRGSEHSKSQLKLVKKYPKWDQTVESARRNYGSNVYKVPTRKEAADFSGIVPPVFPYLCVLCNTATFSEADWSVHVTGGQHAKSQLDLMQKYPKWDGTVQSSRGNDDGTSTDRRENTSDLKISQVKDKSSRVVSFTPLPAGEGITSELTAIVKRFGSIKKSLFLTKRGYVEMTFLTQAKSLVKYYSTHQLKLKGKLIQVTYSCKYNSLREVESNDKTQSRSSRTQRRSSQGRHSTSPKKGCSSEKTHSSPKRRRSSEKTHSSPKRRRSSERTHSSPKRKCSSERTHPSPKRKRSSERTHSSPKIGHSSEKTHSSSKRRRASERTHCSPKRRHSSEKTHSSPKRGHSSEKTHSSPKRGHSSEKTHSSPKRGHSSEKTHSSPKRGHASEKTHSSPKRGHSSEKTHSSPKRGHLSEKPPSSSKRRLSSEKIHSSPKREHSSERTHSSPKRRRSSERTTRTRSHKLKAREDSQKSKESSSSSLRSRHSLKCAAKNEVSKSDTEEKKSVSKNCAKSIDSDSDLEGLEVIADDGEELVHDIDEYNSKTHDQSLPSKPIDIMNFHTKEQEKTGEGFTNADASDPSIRLKHGQKFEELEDKKIKEEDYNFTEEISSDNSESEEANGSIPKTKVLSDEVATSTSAVSFTKQSDESELPKGEDFIKTTVEPMDLENLPDPIDQPEGELDTERKANNLKGFVEMVYAPDAERVAADSKNQSIALRGNILKIKVSEKHCHLPDEGVDSDNEEVTGEEISEESNNQQQPQALNGNTTESSETVEPVGTEFVRPVVGYFCSLCNFICVSEEEAKGEHCRSPSHHEKVKEHKKRNVEDKK